ncbi:hypothetical protein PoB_007188000 [Plakobranchus ocellatus]|uniref:Uncharacterized protein n=1 Tax=Plakobranchus ocellatus TaxID=259542 RepID=A0AAV4DMX4_9GAST|nr:hypothetical protein PoB_007188000 [Plakobranchus ocellatus]
MGIPVRPSYGVYHQSGKEQHESSRTWRWMFKAAPSSLSQTTVRSAVPRKKRAFVATMQLPAVLISSLRDNVDRGRSRNRSRSRSRTLREAPTATDVTHVGMKAYRHTTDQGAPWRQMSNL